MSKITEALRTERMDRFEISIRDDKAKLSEFRQAKAENTKPRLIDAERSEITGY